jgi:hypothetical protein
VDVNLLSRDEVASLTKTFVRELPQPLFHAVPAMQWVATRTPPLVSFSKRNETKRNFSNIQFCNFVICLFI